jgi:hypothetical protein
MLVFGDAKRREKTGEKIERLRAGLAHLGDLRPGIERHGALAGWLMEAGELEQGLLDHQLAREGNERMTPLAGRLARLTRGIAEALLASFLHRGRPRSFDGVRSAAAPMRAALRILRDLRGAGTPDELDVTVPEGYAFYGLYPETYLQAAAALRREWPGAVRVIGIRSIGTSLGAAVAAVAAGPGAEPAFSVRPGGHPFARTLTLGDRLSRKLLAGAGEIRFAVVDEGPGLSGSSFGAVADWLEDHGVAAESIDFFPSHAGSPGPHATARHRSRWERSRRHVCDFAELFTQPGCLWPLASWVEDLTGAPEGTLQEIGAGRWRDLLYPAGAERPPVHLQQERRKYLLITCSGRWLLKFAGLGRYGEEKLERAAALQEAGLIPPLSGLRHGFLVGSWLEDARPLPLAPEADRGVLLEQAACCIAFRAERWPVAPGRGATPQALLDMAEYNAGQALGKEAAEALRAWRDRLPELTAAARPVLTDNRMHAWEWLVLPDGRILKSDALDHATGNDLVGAQDPAWDLAGAIIELDLDGDERARLLELVGRRGLHPSPAALAFYLQTYLAFQLGHWSLAAQAVEAMDAAEASALRKAGERYAERLRRSLEEGTKSPRGSLRCGREA